MTFLICNQVFFILNDIFNGFFWLLKFLIEYLKIMSVFGYMVLFYRG